jgi:hypothetical protein
MTVGTATIGRGVLPEPVHAPEACRSSGVMR